MTYSQSEDATRSSLHSDYDSAWLSLAEKPKADLQSIPYRDLKDALPEGSDIYSTTDISGSLENSFSQIETIGFLQSDPQLQPRNYRPSSLGDHLPGPGEIMVSPEVAEKLGLKIGDVVTAHFQSGSISRQLRVSSVTGMSQALVSSPTIINTDSFNYEDARNSSVTWYFNYKNSGSLINPDNLSKLEEKGFSFKSELLNDYPESTGEKTQQDYLLDVDLFLSFLFGMLLLVAVTLLLISPAFSVLATKHARMFSLMATQGATPRQIRSGIVSFGAALGIAGGLCGIVLGTCLGSAVWLHYNSTWWPTIPWTMLAILLLTCVIGSALLAAIPAFLVARMAISQGIAGATPDRLRYFHWRMLIGPILFFCGIALRFVSQYASVMTFAALLWIISIPLSAPIVVWAFDKILSRSTTSLRLAHRNVLRNSFRSLSVLSAIAAVLGIIFGIGLVSSTGMVDIQTENRNIFTPDQLAISYRDSTPEEVEKTIHELLPTSTVTRFSYFYSFDVITPLDKECPPEDPRDMDSEQAATCLAQNRHHTATGGLDNVVFADSSILQSFRLEATSQTQAVEALNRGDILVSEDWKHYLDRNSGKISLSFEAPDQDTAEPSTLTREYQAVAVLPPRASTILINQREESNIPWHPNEELVIRNPSPIREKDIQQLRERLENLSGSATVTWVNNSLAIIRYPCIVLGIATLIATLVSTFTLLLARRDLQREYQLLDALGAPPRLPRKINAAYSAIIAFIATALGLTVGSLFLHFDYRPAMYDVNGELLQPGTLQSASVPLLIEATGLFIIPLLAWCIGWLATGKIAPLVVRPD
ncbi:ABC transporter permease [Corynebacterium poyangense]|uniref:ABC transporter permease n=1 Tax=Corynebacterium poyangense TaxID=2684405 RepID=UPI00165CF1F8|nr:FtsX-like permease family protein [Corynebacterium poyangense]